MQKSEEPAVAGGILKAINSSASRSRSADYCESKATHVIGINCKAGYWQDEAAVTDAFYHKEGKGRQYYHYVYSLPPGHGTPEELIEMVARGIDANPILSGHEIELAIHADKAHLHCHILINATSAVDGRKLRFSHRQYREWIGTMKVIAKEYGFAPVVSKVRKQGDFITNDKLKREVVVNKGKDSDIVHTYQSVLRAMTTALGWDDLKKILAKDGVSLEMKPTRKHLVFGYGGHKFRDSNLSRTFSDVITKEVIENGFELQNRKQQSKRGEYECDEQNYRERINAVLEDANRALGSDESRKWRGNKSLAERNRRRTRTHRLS